MEDKKNEAPKNEVPENKEPSLFNKAIVFAGNILGPLFALAGHVIHVFLNHLLFDGHERLDIQGVYQRAVRNTENDKKNGGKDENNGKDGNSDKDEVTKGTKTQAQQTQKQKTQDEEKKVVNTYAKYALNQEAVQKVFQNLGIDVSTTTKSDKILLLKEDEKGFQNILCAIEKKDLYNHNSQNLAAALLKHENPCTTIRDMDLAKMNCAVKAMLAITAIESIVNKDFVKELQIHGNSEPLAVQRLNTMYGPMNLSICPSKDIQDCVSVMCNNKELFKIPTDTLESAPFEKLESQIKEQVEKAYQFDKRVVIGTDEHDIKLRIKNNVVSVKGSEEKEGSSFVKLGLYKFETTKDVRTLARILDKQNFHIALNGKSISNEAFAYAIGTLSNPDMRPERNNKGHIVSPFTGKVEPDGKAHLFLEPTKECVNIKMFCPTEEMPTSSMIVNHFSYHKSEQDFINIASTVQDALETMQTREFVNKEYDREDSFKDVSVTEDMESPIIVSKEDLEEFSKELKEDAVFEDISVNDQNRIEALLEEMGNLDQADGIENGVATRHEIPKEDLEKDEEELFL